MQKLIKHRHYLFGLAFALAIVSANVMAFVAQPCGFKWGGG
jgi:hypothetical protein